MRTVFRAANNIFCIVFILGFLSFFADGIDANMNKAGNAITKIKSFGEGPQRVKPSPLFY